MFDVGIRVHLSLSGCLGSYTGVAMSHWLCTYRQCKQLSLICVRQKSLLPGANSSFTSVGGTSHDFSGSAPCLHTGPLSPWGGISGSEF